MVILEGQRDIYVPIKQLSAQGAEAQIYLCENRDGNHFAARIYHKNTEGNCLVQRFLYETECPYLLKLYDHGAGFIYGKNCSFEIFEYMEHGTLADGAPFDEYTVEKQLLPCLNEALHAMHQAGLVHRDVKPTNLYLVRTEDDKLLAKLGDFGISAEMGEEGKLFDCVPAYTPGYAPAEVISTGMYSAASDYYALAVSVYYLLTGRQIYEGMEPDEIAVKTKRGEMPVSGLISSRMAGLLEGLMIQDVRYRWGYKEVKAWLQGANVPVFRYTQEMDLLEPPYQLTANVRCSSLRELSQALMEYPEEGMYHLYEGLLADGLRRQYQHLAGELLRISGDLFLHTRHAGLAAAIHLLAPEPVFYWNGRTYQTLSEAAASLSESAADGILQETDEELLRSGILNHIFGGQISEEERMILSGIQKQAESNPLLAASEAVLRLQDKCVYQPEKGVEIADIKAYIDYLGHLGSGLSRQLWSDFNRVYFICWLEATGFSKEYQEWKKFFYPKQEIADDHKLVANTCQFLEKICPQASGILRGFVIRELKQRPEYWLKRHLNLYQTDEMMEHMLSENFENIDYHVEDTIPRLMHNRYELEQSLKELRRDFLNNPYLYQKGIYDVTNYRIFSSSLDAYFVETKENGYVPIGWLKEQKQFDSSSVIQSGLMCMKKKAKRYMKQFSEQADRWSRLGAADCEERRVRRQIPGLAGGICSLLSSLFLLFIWGRASEAFLEGSSLFAKSGFILTFLTLMLCLIAGIQRLNKYRSWKNIQHSIHSLGEIAKEVQLIAQDVEAEEVSGQIKQTDGNIEMEAQAERAYGNYLLEYRRMKNALLPYYLVFFISAGILAGGLYLDGNLSFGEGGFFTQAQSLLSGSVIGKQTKSDKFEVSVSRARLRSGPGTSYEILNTYENGTEMTAGGKEQSDGSKIWYQVTAPDGTIGWMREDTIKRR